MISFKFIYRVKVFFKQIKLNINDNIEIDVIYDYLLRSLLRIKYVIDINDLIVEYLFCRKNMKKIKKMLLKVNKRKVFDYIDIESDQLKERFDEDSNIIITNCFGKKSRDYDVIDSEDNQGVLAFSVIRLKKNYFVFSDYSFYGKRKGNYFDIYDKSNTLIIKVKLEKKKDNLYFVNRLKKSNYAFVTNNGYLDVFDNLINEKEEIGTLSNDILADKLFKKTTASLWLYDNNYYEIMVLIAIGINTLVSRYFKIQQDKQYAMMSISLQNLRR